MTLTYIIKLTLQKTLPFKFIKNVAKKMHVIESFYFNRCWDKTLKNLIKKYKKYYNLIYMGSKYSGVWHGLTFVNCAGYTFSGVDFSLVSSHTILVFIFIFNILCNI